MFKKFTILNSAPFFLLLVCTININAQRKLDSLLQVLGKYKKEDTVKLDLLNSIAVEYQYSNISKGLETADTAIALAKKLNNQIRLAAAFLAKGENFYRQGDNNQSSLLCRQALTIYKQFNHKKGTANCMNDLGNISLRQGDDTNAFEYFKKAIDLNKQTGNITDLGIAYVNTGNVYEHSFDHAKALDSYGKALKIYEQTGDKRRMIALLNNIGGVYYNQSDLTSSLLYYQKALAICEQLGEKGLMVNSLINIGGVYRNLGDFDKALEYRKKALEISKQIGVKDISNDLFFLGAVYSSMAQYDEAIKNYLEAIRIKEQSGSEAVMPNILNNIGFDYYKLADYIKAWEYYQRGISISEKYNNKYCISLFSLSMGELSRDAPDSILPQIGLTPENRFIKTLEYLDKGKQVANEINNLVLQRYGWEDLSIMYENQKDFSHALNAYKNYIILRDSIVNNEKEKKITHLAMQYEFDKKADSLRLQEQLTNEKLKQQELLAKQQQQQLELGRKELDLINKEKDLQRLAYLKTQADLQNEQLQKNEKEKQLVIAEKEKKLQQAEAIKIQGNNRVRMYALFSALVVFLLVAILLWRNNLHKQKANALLQQQKQQTEQQKTKAEQALQELEATQSQLIQREKMASLGELTAGIAHEIQNPLNFVNNFSEVTTELIAEMEEEIRKGNLEEIKVVAGDIRQNMEKINHHGKRADSIVKGMLQHSRISTGKKELTDINALADEYLRLSFHGKRAKEKSFNATIETDFDEHIPKINIVQQDLARVLLNLFNNAFYAVAEKKKKSGDGYEPTVFVITKHFNSPSGVGGIEIRVKDNGNGIPEKIMDKIYQPFFTTKPTGQGTGLGLSLSYDIITKGIGGNIKAETKEGEYAEFIVQLPA